MKYQCNKQVPCFGVRVLSQPHCTFRELLQHCDTCAKKLQSYYSAVQDMYVNPGTQADRSQFAKLSIFAHWIRVTNQVSWFHPRTQAYIQFNHVNTHLENFLKLCIVFNYKDICLAIFSNILTCFWRICGINTHSKSPEMIRNELNVNNEQEYCNNNDNVLLSKC